MAAAALEIQLTDDEIAALEEPSVSSASGWILSDPRLRVQKGSVWGSRCTMW